MIRDRAGTVRIVVIVLKYATNSFVSLIITQSRQNLFKANFVPCFFPKGIRYSLSFG